VRLGRQQPSVDVRGFAAAAWRTAQEGSAGGFVLPEQQVVRFPLNQLAGFQAERLSARASPAARRLSPGLAGLDVIPGRVLGQGGVDLLPDVVQVVALAQGRDNGQASLAVRGREAAGLTTVIVWCMGVTRLRIMNQ
jgi:hypothetical protein